MLARDRRGRRTRARRATRAPASPCCTRAACSWATTRRARHRVGPAARTEPVLAGVGRRSPALERRKVSRPPPISRTRTSPSTAGAPARGDADANCCSRCRPATRASSSACSSGSPTNAASPCVASSMPGWPPAPPVPPALHMLHLDLQLHQAVGDAARDWRAAEGVLRRTRYELLPGAGELRLAAGDGRRRSRRLSCARRASIRCTRPPRSSACTTCCPAGCRRWRRQRRSRSGNRVRRDDAPHPADARAADDAVEPLASDILRLVQAARPPGAPLQLCVLAARRRDPRAGRAARRVARLRDGRAAARRGGARARCVRRTPSCGRPTPSRWCIACRSPRRSCGARCAAALARSRCRPDAVPTHVLFRGRAWPITAVPLTLGWSVGTVPRALTLPAGIAGVSRSHCTLAAPRRPGRRRGPQHLRHVRQRRARRRAASRCSVGDVLRLGAPGVSLELIRVLADHGTP